MWDTVILIINIILAIVSGTGAWKSVKYFKKNKELMIYTQSADVIDEVNDMLKILIKALEIANRKVKKQGRGTNYGKEICDCGKKLAENYQNIERNIPARYHNKLRDILDDANFNFREYINSYVSGHVLINDGLDHTKFTICQGKLYALQSFLKEERDMIEEKLK